MTRRFQFSLKTLLWLTLVVVAFFGGMAVDNAMTRQNLQDLLNKIDKKASETVRKDAVSRMREARLDALEREADRVHRTEKDSE